MSDETKNRLFLFGDESGCLVFKKNGTASRYFVLATACFRGPGSASELLSLRRELLWLRNKGAIRTGTRIDSHFHATADEKSIRHAVYRRIKSLEFRVDATILEKQKAMPHITADSADFYKYAWFYHLKHVSGKIIKDCDTELHLLPSAIGTSRKRANFLNSVNNVVQQLMPRSNWSVDFEQSSADPGLQVADYCAYAIYQKWERGNDTWYRYISNKVCSEFDLWKNGKTIYY
jgi:hypothetical protein